MPLMFTLLTVTLQLFCAHKIYNKGSIVAHCYDDPLCYLLSPSHHGICFPMGQRHHVCVCHINCHYYNGEQEKQRTTRHGDTVRQRRTGHTAYTGRIFIVVRAVSTGGYI